MQEDEAPNQPANQWNSWFNYKKSHQRQNIFWPWTVTAQFFARDPPEFVWLQNLFLIMKKQPTYHLYNIVVP